ncbi:glycoside hydrolase family 127 protein [Asanoa sp. WMMD1127]|uniref:glycoside hydrolase family 127 protein n=1 Tax=Asanoa sp. WMMD1127 TaxID=3016107 RepID=UPI002417D4E9|nr:beta-L-arabinofuranosidase domain-containing protein [Asanoa sp. WMMD1127]MDG4824658.1 glycoside hydrolase family 127 protein [Asanoa sp. WMMD1127]
MTESAVWPARSRMRPLGGDQTTIHDGFWAERLRVNRERTIPHGLGQLRRAGTLDNLRLAAGAAAGDYRADADSGGAVLPFLDSDVYKWLEAVGWAGDDGLRAAADEVIAVVAAAQRPDGYVNSFVQVVRDGRPYQDLAWGHELYCLGHLVQAGIAWHRALGDDRLLDIATRAVDHAYDALGEEGIDGHPEIEMALVELARVRGEPRYTEFAARMLDRRGHGRLGEGRFGPAYWQDHAPVRTATEVAGHAVRQLYLDCGAVDVAVERGDTELLDAVRRRWDDMVRTRRYLTGALGSRHRDEAFGDPYELPPDRAYAETCAAIASVMLAWRLLLATGEPAYADDIERAMFNGVLSGLSRSGTEFFYTNPLHRRTHRTYEPAGHGQRAPWQACACCPPNLMRLLSSWPHYLATGDETGLQIHQYATSTIRVGEAEIAVRTHYPWDGRVDVSVMRSPQRPWTLALRVPGWCAGATLAVAGQEPLPVAAGYAERTRVWAPGDRVTLDLPLPARCTEPDPRVDAVRGCVAFERGPIVYCVESADLPETVDVDDLRWDPAREVVAVPRPELGEEWVGLDVPVTGGGVASAIPYHAWANRGPGGMRVWLPR